MEVFVGIVNYVKRKFWQEQLFLLLLYVLLLLVLVQVQPLLLLLLYLLVLEQQKELLLLLRQMLHLLLLLVLVPLVLPLHLLHLLQWLLQWLREYQESHIKGWVTTVLLEDWRGELEALRYEWYKKGQLKAWIELKTSLCILDMLKAHIQIEVENAKFFKKSTVTRHDTDI